jgi:hypothetical protein
MTKVLSNFLLTDLDLKELNNVGRKKHFQKLKMIRHLYLNGANTNSEICNTFNFSLPTSMGLVSQLINEGIVEKQGRGESVGGRKPDLYGLRENTFFVLSIHIERFKFKLALVDITNTIISEEDTPS